MAQLTCNNTNIPPKKNARIFAPLLTNTPAQIPQTVPNVRPYLSTLDSGGGGRACGSDNPTAPLSFGGEDAESTGPLSAKIEWLVRNRLTLAV